ncbi:hypothetical protein [Salinispora arenicola]|uniref:hypothetical protein n=1 Tax=Salinispora arenicola TaxID=168697 RepID=UPI0027DEA4BA|nr:hypothetical protein [Salinispora arenicola]
MPGAGPGAASFRAHRRLPEGEGLRFVRGTPVVAGPDLVQVNAFGFGGVNAVTLVGRA